MSKTKHTPGPWRIGEHAHGCIAVEADNPGRTIAMVHVFDSPARGSRNASLIAAAPELLAALNLTLEELDAYDLPRDPLHPQCVAVAAARAAIRAAEGQP